MCLQALLARRALEAFLHSLLLLDGGKGLPQAFPEVRQVLHAGSHFIPKLARTTSHHACMHVQSASCRRGRELRLCSKK
jgi:hypothetical protein